MINALHRSMRSRNRLTSSKQSEKKKGIKERGRKRYRDHRDDRNRKYSNLIITPQHSASWMLQNASPKTAALIKFHQKIKIKKERSLGAE